MPEFYCFIIKWSSLTSKALINSQRISFLTGFATNFGAQIEWEQMSRSLQKGFLCYPSGQVHSSIWMEYGPNPLEIPSKRFRICLFASEWASRLQKTAPTWSNKGHPIGSRCWLPVYMILRSCPRLLGLFYSEVCHCVGIKQIAESSPVEMRICTQFSMVAGSCLSMNDCKGLSIIGKCIKSLHNNKGLWWWCTWQIWSEMEMQIVANFSESCNAFPQNMGTFQEGRRQEFEKALWIWRLSIALKRPLGLANLSISPKFRYFSIMGRWMTWGPVHTWGPTFDLEQLQ